MCRNIAQYRSIASLYVAWTLKAGSIYTWHLKRIMEFMTWPSIEWFYPEKFPNFSFEF